MNRLRHSLLALTAGVVALLATFFVATATLASSPPQVKRDVAMSAGIPCEPEATVCAPDCAVRCQALVIQPPMVERLVGHFRATYRVLTTVLGSLSVGAEDPPPR